MIDADRVCDKNVVHTLDGRTLDVHIYNSCLDSDTPQQIELPKPFAASDLDSYVVRYV